MEQEVEIKEMKYEDIVNQLHAFFKKGKIVNRNKTNKDIDYFSYWDELIKINGDYPENKSLYIEYRHIQSFNRELAEKLLDHPCEWLKAASATIAEIEFPIINMPDIMVRIIGLPQHAEIPISKLRNNHVEKFISIRCVISKATEVRPAYDTVAFKCLRCGYITKVIQAKDSDLLEEPFSGCENDTCGKKGPFKRIDEESITFNHQYIKIQEPLENLRGRQPEYMYVSCADELAGIRKPGDKVIITGVLKSKIKVQKEGKSKFLDIFIVANSIQLSDKDYESIEITTKDEEKIKELSKRDNIKDVIISSIAPSIFGHKNIKEGLALQLFSGNGKDMEDGTHKRGDIHILMVGDPGVAKSQFLKFIANFAPRAIQVSGRSTSAAGLTGAAVRDDFDGKWAIEAGALTMAGQGGVCCVDELDKMNDKDRGSMHDALEQQYVNVAKAGVFAQLPTGCSLLGAANPKYGCYDEHEGIASQFNLGDALLSRMDLLYVMRDKPNQEKDEELAWYILNDEVKNTELVDLELLRKYIAYSRTRCNPKMTEEAKAYIVNFFVITRKSSGSVKDTVPITVRALEAAKRLSVANAKLRLSDYVEEKDAKQAVKLLLDNLKEVGIDPITGTLDNTVLECGISTNQSNKIKQIKNIISDMCKKNLSTGVAKIDEVIAECKKQGIIEPEVIINKMKTKGDICQINKTNYKVVNK